MVHSSSLAKIQVVFYLMTGIYQIVALNRHAIYKHSLIKTVSLV